MKKLLFISILFAAVVNARAGEPVSNFSGPPESAYNVSHSTVAISSQTVSSDAAVQGYRATYLFNLSATTTIFYTLSSSTQNVVETGWPIFPWRTPTGANPIPEKIEYNGQINYRLGAGAVGSMDVTKKTIRK